MENSEKKSESKQNENEYDNLLKDTYSIDDESFKDESSSPSKSSISSAKKTSNTNSKYTKELSFVSLINAIKDDDSELVDSILKANNNSHFLSRVSLEGYNAIQYATMFSSIKTLNLLFANKAQLDSKVEGLPLIHLALSFADFTHSRNKAKKCFEYIAKNYPNMLSDKDRLGRSVLHKIVFSDLNDFIVFNINLDDLVIEDNNGNSVLDYFYLYNAKECFKKIFCEMFIIPNLYDILNSKRNHFDKFIENCFLYGAFDILSLILSSSDISHNLSESIKNILNYYSPYEDSVLVFNCTLALKYLEDYSTPLQFKTFTNKTAFIYNNDCVNHLKLPDDPIKRMAKRNELYENSDRLCVLIQPPYGILLSDTFTSSHNFSFIQTQRRASLADILKVHDITYIKYIKEKCESIEKENEDVLIDSDTLLSKKTFDNIFNTAGCVMEAVDVVMESKSKNAFAIVRPPGHHVGAFGAVDNEEGLPKSNGFCVVNNVCIAAAYCKYKYSDKAKKVAIIDFDVHHGNGTEEIVQLLNEKKFSCSTSSPSLGEVTMSKTMTHPWYDFNDAENVLFISLHYFNESNPKTFYPYTGSTALNTKKSSPIYPGGVLNIPFNGNNKYSYDYRDAIRSKVIPRLCKFEPDVIFISAGFDAHENEVINDGKMLLQEYDFAFITNEIQKVANRYSEGRVISVLEGGYNVKTGIVSSFAQSVMIHARYLNIGVNKEVFGDVALTKVKRKREYDRDYEIFKKISRFENKPRRSERIKHLEEEKENHNNNSSNKKTDSGTKINHNTNNKVHLNDTKINAIEINENDDDNVEVELNEEDSKMI